MTDAIIAELRAEIAELKEQLRAQARQEERVAAVEQARQEERAAAAAMIAELQAQVIRIRQERLRVALPRALSWALWETRLYHKTALTGRCGAAAGW